MSTKAPLGRTSILCVALMLASCAAPSAGPQASRFSQIGFGGRTDSDPTPALRPRLPAPDTFAAVVPVSLNEAQTRVAAYLDRTGFALETRPEGGGELVSATRMGGPSALDGQATCALEAMRRPTLSSTELTVRISPAAGGVSLQTDARFVEIDTKIISGDLARETCRSRGVLERAVRQAALGG